MGYRNLKQCLLDLKAQGALIVIDQEVDAELEVGAIQRRVFQAKGPALLFTRVKNCPFPMAANIFGTLERTRYIFRDTLKRVERLVRLKVDPADLFRHLGHYARIPQTLYQTLPRKVKDGPVLAHTTRISQLPHLKSWPRDGGGYITLPQVYSESLSRPGFMRSNLGMYRIQLSGNQFDDHEIGLHYQIHRGIGFHHAEAIGAQRPFPVNIFVGGPPAMTLAAIMPLPEGLPELFFAGALGGHRINMIDRGGELPILAEADFCITGVVDPDYQKLEGPFGDHLGYYSLAHRFPVLRVHRVYHRRDAVWPFTTVGRPPQEDTIFGRFIHELTGPLVPTVFNGVHEVHAVDAAGVHPLLLAIGSERYVPYASERTPQEIITCGLSLLGTSQTSLSKYVLICAREDQPDLSTHDIPLFFKHLLERADWNRDLHFITRTTIDTLDYSGISLNQGSKVVIAVAGPPRIQLGMAFAATLRFPQGFDKPRLFFPGILVIEGPRHQLPSDTHDDQLIEFAAYLSQGDGLQKMQLIVVVDDADFTVASWDNFLWVTFTRSDPATDIYGIGAFSHCKHWGCQGALIIDARLKTYHAEPLADDPQIESRVDELGKNHGPLKGII